MTITKRGFVRVISFSVGTCLALLAAAGLSYGEAQKARRSLEYTYLRAVEDLSLNLDNISNNLEKGMYTNSISMLSTLSEKLCSDAATAKSALAQLPVHELELEKTNRFLSQVGNYSKSLAEKCARGEHLTDEERANITALYQYAENLSGSMWQVEEKIRGGEMTFERTGAAAGSYGAESESATITDGFQSFETMDNSYPSLIYDGPFSDHIMEKNPLMLEGAKEIDEEEALRRAVSLTGADDLRVTGSEAGKMPSYVFENDNITIAVTKAGGSFSYMLKGRPVGKAAMTGGEACTLAREYLERMGLNNLKETYYEIERGVCIVNFAAMQNGVKLYTDLVKAEVALDDGEILSFDMRGYLTNHTIRELPEAKISKEKAISLISPNLAANAASLCVIPSGGQNELFCYEVKCVSESGQNVLVYINALTGREEQILLLRIGSGGTLTV